MGLSRWFRILEFTRQTIRYGYDFFLVTIHGAHSPDERASIKSSQEIYKFVLERF
jgi:acetylornithine deacetylase/succinyl-diaminopimelate desuccinylase-like protein